MMGQIRLRNYLEGLSQPILSGGIDEFFVRADASTTVTPLADALGSIIALVDSNGNLITQYSYDPFGNTTASGAASSNPWQYSGREDDGNGLYYYRARYYSSMLGRFISEDPLGFAGSGPNVYAYTNNSPTNLVDPYGLESGDLDKLVPGPNGETARKPLAGRKDDPYPKRLFGTHWCGPGGAGPPLNALDEGCMVHDHCYDAAGVSADANTGSGMVTLDQATAMQACNEALYAVAVAHPEIYGSKWVNLWLEHGDGVGVLAPGTAIVPYIPELTAQERMREQYYQNQMSQWMSNPRSF